MKTTMKFTPKQLIVLRNILSDDFLEPLLTGDDGTPEGYEFIATLRGLHRYVEVMLEKTELITRKNTL